MPKGKRQVIDIGPIRFETQTEAIAHVSEMLRTLPQRIPLGELHRVGDLNITNYDEYVWANPMAFKDCLANNPTFPVGSVETTHGLIRSMSEAPFLFVSGITNRLGYLRFENGSHGRIE